MIARLWRGATLPEKAEEYGRYVIDKDLTVSHYQVTEDEPPESD